MIKQHVFAAREGVSVTYFMCSKSRSKEIRRVKWKSQTRANADEDTDTDAETSALTNVERVVTSVCVDGAEAEGSVNHKAW